MQPTVPLGAAPVSPAVPVVVSPRSLAAAFTRIADPRRAARVTYPLAAVLSLAVTAILAQQLSVLAIAQWGARQPAERLRLLGFPTGQTPCQSTLQRLFCRLDGQALAEALRTHFAPVAVPLPVVAGSQGVGEEKSEAELTVAPALLARVAWPGRVLTGDALFCQRHLCQQVLDAGGDYVLLVKENQPTLYADIQLLFDAPAGLAPLPLLDRREARTVDRGHGRQRDTGHLVASTDLNDYLGWPGLAQVFRLERTWHEHGRPKHARHYGIASLTPSVGPPERLLGLKRGHWVIEHGLHRVKDLALGEDQSTIHCGQGPIVMALLRDAGVSLMHRAGIFQITARLRAHAQDPTPAVALVVAPPPTPAHA